MPDKNPTASDEQDAKGFKGLGQLRAKVTPAPATPAAPALQSSRVGAAPPTTVGANQAPKASTSGTPPQPSPPQPQVGSSSQPVSSPAPQGSSPGLPIWLIVGAIALIALYKYATNVAPPTDSTTTTASRQDGQQARAPYIPSTPPPQPAYIATAMANIRASANAHAAVVGQLHQWTEISVTGVEGAWSHITFSSPTGAADGYILSRLIQAGTAHDAWVAYCEVPTTVRPASGTVLLQVAIGSHSIKVDAGASDALVKLRQHGKTELAFFVRANETGTVTNLADGTYQIMFATGDGFSRKCMEFVNSMQVLADPSPATFQTRQVPTADGVMVYSSSAEYRLTEQVGGNFKPQNMDPSAFRE